MSTAGVVDFDEAVIISGQRRGEIIRLDQGTSKTEDAAAWKAINEGLDRLNLKLEYLSKDIRSATQAVRSGNKGK